MSEVAIVRDTSAQQRSWGRLDGVPAVRIQIRKQPEANTVEVADGVRARLAQLQTSSFVPKDVKYVVTFRNKEGHVILIKEFEVGQAAVFNKKIKPK